MNGFQTQTTSPATTAPDPHKHVKYSLGMVLGVDDFDQEFAYLSNRDQWLARDTIGYGTVCGLKVSIETDERGPRVSVEPGVAINPRGQLIRVTPAQCAYLNDWLDAHREDVIRELGSPPADQLTLYVVLCYRDCPTDPVPIPGEPCRDETEATVTSRLEDDFKLDLRFTPPDQTEENAVRDFVEWMSHIEISDGATSLSLDDFLAAIRDGAQLSSPPSPPTDYMYGSPPSGIVINNADACEYLRAAMRVWVTELRPLWRGVACDGSTPDEDCVLLAQLDVPLVDGSVSSDEDVIVSEEQRPFLVHLRMLQEWLLCGPHAIGSGGGSTLSGDAVGPISNTIVERIQQVAVAPILPDGGQVLTFDAEANQWAPMNPVGGTTTLDGDVTGAADDNTVERLQHVVVAATPPTGRQVLTFDSEANQWTPRDLPATNVTLNGDVTGAANNTIVDGIGQIPIDLTTLDDGEVLIFNKAQGKWLPGSAGGTSGSDFVEHPAGLPRYFIDAAGIVRVNAPHQAPIYNNLRTVGIPSDGVVVFIFDGYVFPVPDNLRYIVKALPVFQPQVELNIVVNFLRFDKDGFYLWVTRGNGQPIDAKTLSTIEFMIEVSEYRDKTSAVVRSRVDLNTATADELRSLPRVGPALANRIVAARRKTRGGFKTLEDVAAVDGIGADTLRIIEPFVTLSHK